MGCENGDESMEGVKIVQATGRMDKAVLTCLSLESAEKVLSFHQSFPMYRETPLTHLKQLAAELGIEAIYVKDESFRFGLNAFKVLGGSYAIGNYIAGRLGIDISELPYEELISEEIREKTGEITFVTATDGNHGRGVAWTANQLKQKSVVYMPKGSSLERLDNIRAEGADALITDLNYDDTVRFADKQARENGWVLVQDTAWGGYENIPVWIMQGYGTMGLEAYGQLGRRPTHIFLQAGVGSMAAAVTGFFSSAYGENKPIITIVEPNEADCLYRTAKAADGQLHFVTGEMKTMMAGLACGEPCTIAWSILESWADYFVSCPDRISVKGMQMLGNPLKGDPGIVSGESGSVTAGLVAEIMQNRDLSHIREQLHLGKDSVVLCFSTEGDTDKENYKRIVRLMELL